MSTTEAPPFHQRMQRIEELVGRVEQSSDPAAREAAREMIRAVLDLHAEGLARMVGSLSEIDADGRAILDRWTTDELVASLLLLHGLHPEDLEARVDGALEKARPYLHSHGGDVELLEISEGTVRLRMQGSCHGCPSSGATLKFTIEQAIHEAAPDVAAIEVEGLDEPPSPSDLVQLGADGNGMKW